MLHLNQLDTYINSGQYENEIHVLVKKAMHIVEKAIVANARSKTIVFDVDETILSNAPYILANKQFFLINKQHNGLSDLAQSEFERLIAWQHLGQCLPIKPMVDFYAWLLLKPVVVVFITARTLSLKHATLKNLEAMKLPLPKVLFRDATHWPMPKLYKAAMRREIVDSGSDIILNIGDQPADFEGGYWQEALHIPNPFYQSDPNAIY